MNATNTSPYRLQRPPTTWTRFPASPGSDWEEVFALAVRGLRAGWRANAFDAARFDVAGRRGRKVNCPRCADWGSHSLTDRRFNGHHASCHHGQGQW
jgi:hypothetical protein